MTGNRVLLVGQNKISDRYYYLGKVFTAKVDLCNDMGNALSNIGKEVSVYDASNRCTEVGISKMNEEVIQLAEDFKPQYAIFMLGETVLFNSTLKALKEKGITLIGYFFDDAKTFKAATEWRLGLLDYCVTVDSPDSVRLYEESGWTGKAIFLPVGSNCTDFYKKEIPYAYDATFIGQNYLGRKEFMETLSLQLVKSGREKVECFGLNWRNGVVSKEMMNDIYNGTKINLCLTDTSSGKTQLKGKLFDICMAGGFLLTQYADGLEKIFRPDKEIVCFTSLDDAVGKIEYYLRHEEEREQIAQEGYKRAVENYTWDSHFKILFRKMINEDDCRNQGGYEYALTTKARNTIIKVCIDSTLAFYLDRGLDNPYLWRDNLKIPRKIWGIFDKKVFLLGLILHFIPFSVNKKILEIVILLRKKIRSAF